MQKIKAFFSRVRKYIKGVLKKGGVPAGAQGGVGANRPGRCMPGDGTGDTRLFGTEELQKIKAPPPAAHENEPLFKERVRRRPFILSVLFTSLRFAIIGVLLLGLVFAGAGIGIAKAYVDTSPEIDLSLLTKSDRTSFIYDKDGQLITSIAEVEYRDWVDIEDIPERVRHAFVAVEDIRFYMHTGVDAKRLFSAVLEILGNSNSSGGSTITQQLVKNKILTNERTYKRKIQEVYLAFELEKQIEKDDILEAYLNDIHLGESNYGVKTAAMDYFGKELDALSIRECALLAGLTQNPYYYNPRLNRYKRDESRWEETMKRTDKVLLNMYEAGYIDMREYEQALKEEVSILEVSEQKQLYDMPYFVEYAIRDVVTHLIAQRGLTESDRKSVETQLRTGGYHIYTTVDSDIQHRVQETLSTWDKYPELARPDESVKTETVGSGEVMETIQPQASAVVIDYHTGELRAIVGGRDTPKIRKSFNRAYQGYMELGSAIKPLAVYGPAFDAGASPATIIGNFPAPIQGWTKSPGYPYIGSSDYIGPLSIRQGIVSSLNVMAVRTLYEYVTPEVGAQYLINMDAVPSKINADGPGLALGTSTLTTIQTAAAFGAIAAGGEYIKPMSFTKVVDGDGNVVLNADTLRETRRIYKESSAYMLVDVLTDAVNRGTGKRARIDNMTVAGKTGTNSDYKSVYFAGMTPYYAAAVWVGHDDPSASTLKKGTGGEYAAPIWQAFMEPIHEGLPNKSIIDTPPSSLGLVRKTVCQVSGLLATDACYADQTGHTPITDWMLDENAPTTMCDMHAAVAICSESGAIATQYCPESSVVGGAVVLINPGTYYDQFTDEELSTGLTNYVRTMLPLDAYVENMTDSYGRCLIHGYEGAAAGETDDGQSNYGDSFQTLRELRLQSQELRAEIKEFIDANSLELSENSKLNVHMTQLDALARGNSPDKLRQGIANARADYEAIRDKYLG